jgi:hypothetical protein
MMVLVFIAFSRKKLPRAAAAASFKIQEFTTERDKIFAQS